MEQRQDEAQPYRRKDTLEDARGPESAQPAEGERDAERERTDLFEERLAARRRERQIGEVAVRKEVEEVPGRIDVETYHDEVQVEHVPVGRIVNEREESRQEGDDLVIPIYEEQVVMVKRLVLKEYVRVRRTRATERQVYADTVRRDRLVVEGPQDAGLVREVYRGSNGEDIAQPKPTTADGIVEWLKKALFS